MSYTSVHQVRVRYGETDQMGYVYYGVYAQYFEVGRVEAMRELGILYAEMERTYKILMPVMNMQVRYLRPGRYDDLLSIHTTIPELPDRHIRFRTEIHNENGEIITNAMIQLCFLDATTQQRINTPEFILKPLKAYF